MNQILIIDTSTKYLSLALVQDEKIIAHKLEKNQFSHASHITIEIDLLVKSIGSDLVNLSAIAINQGPGSFTGLRVGSSVAKGLCFGLEIPLIAIEGLEAYGLFFYEYFEKNYDEIFVLLDARRDNFFYSHIVKGEIQTKTKFDHISEIETSFYLAKKSWIYNSSKEMDFDLEAKFLSKMAIGKWQKKDFVDINLFEPNYMLNNYQSGK